MTKNDLQMKLENLKIKAQSVDKEKYPGKYWTLRRFYKFYSDKLKRIEAREAAGI